MSFSQRTSLLVGEDGVRVLQQSHVAVFGLGGVGSFAAEALARAGVGRLSLFDGDTVCASNLNRQLVALHSTLGQNKAEVMAKRIADIHPACETFVYPVFYTPQNAQDYPFSAYHYVVDATDMVTAKLEIIRRAKAAEIAVISCMGAGNKFHPECFEVADISKTEVCPLARVMRRELKKQGITKVKTVFSKENPFVASNTSNDEKLPCGTLSFVPGAAGLVLAGAVVRDLLCLA